MKNNKLSIVILSFNVAELLNTCILSIKKAEQKLLEIGFEAEIIVPDNASKDNTLEMMSQNFPEIRLIQNENIGFARGNNSAREFVDGKYLLILNPDTTIDEDVLVKCTKYMEEHKDVGAMTCKTVLPNGNLDKDVRRSFPTPWVALSHFSYLDRLFPSSQFFAKYWYSYIPEDEIHEVDVIQGAFTFIRTGIMEKINWYDEDYFLDGEDIDLCWKIKKLGYKIMYYPRVKIVHYKGACKGKTSSKKYNKKVDKNVRKRAIETGVSSMKIFYKKHMAKTYPAVLNTLVYVGIDAMRVLRLIIFTIKGSR